MSKKNEIINQIKNKIINEEWKPGYKIKSEKYLAEDLGISRTTLRLALNDLALMGYIEKKIGSGNYVKDNISKDSRYIILVFPNLFTKRNDIYTTFHYILAKIKNLLLLKGYKVFVYYRDPDKNFFDYINIKPEEISLWLCIAPDGPIPETEQYNIPVINILNILEFYYNISIDITDIFIKADYLINKYNLKNSIIFLHSDNKKELLHYKLNTNGIIDYFRTKANIIPVMGENYSSSERVNQIKEGILKYGKNADAFIFSDDSIYKDIFTFLNNHKELTENKKIITHSNRQDTFIYPKNVCRLEFDLDEFSNIILSQTEKIINSKPIIHPSIWQKVKIINEEVLQ